MSCVLDTHALIWAFTGDSSLSPAAGRALANARRGEVLVSDVTLSEAARLIFAGRLLVQGDPGAWLASLAAYATIVPVVAETAWRAAGLRWTHRDPSDRQIVATALWHGAALLTADRVITQAAQALGLMVVW